MSRYINKCTKCGDECLTHGWVPGGDDGYDCPLCRVSELQSENARLRSALEEIKELEEVEQGNITVAAWQWFRLGGLCLLPVTSHPTMNTKPAVIGYEVYDPVERRTYRQCSTNEGAVRHAYSQWKRATGKEEK